MQPDNRAYTSHCAYTTCSNGTSREAQIPASCPPDQNSKFVIKVSLGQELCEGEGRAGGEDTRMGGERYACTQNKIAYTDTLHKGGTKQAKP